MGFQECFWKAELLVWFGTLTSVFPKPRQEKLKATTKRTEAGKAREQVLLHLSSANSVCWPITPIQVWGSSRDRTFWEGRQFPPRCSVVVLGNFCCFHCFALLKKSSVKWKKHTFSGSTGPVPVSLCSVPCTMAQLFFFSAKNIPPSKPRSTVPNRLATSSRRALQIMLHHNTVTTI